MDEDGNEYPIMNIDELNEEELGLIEGIIVEGDIITEEEQVKYTDGTYSRSYMEYFKVK